MLLCRRSTGPWNSLNLPGKSPKPADWQDCWDRALKELEAADPACTYERTRSRCRGRMRPPVVHRRGRRAGACAAMRPTGLPGRARPCFCFTDTRAIRTIGTAALRPKRHCRGGFWTCGPGGPFAGYAADHRKHLPGGISCAGWTKRTPTSCSSATFTWTRCSWRALWRA